MLFFVALAAIVAWIAVLTLTLLGDIQLLFRTIRSTLTLFLIVFGIFLFRVLSEGLLVLQLAEDDSSHILAAWTFWYLWAVASLLFWPFLIPSALALAIALSNPSLRVVLDLGLARLGWAEYVYNPLWHLGKGFWQLPGKFSPVFQPENYGPLNPLMKELLERLQGRNV